MFAIYKIIVKWIERTVDGPKNQDNVLTFMFKNEQTPEALLEIATESFDKYIVANSDKNVSIPTFEFSPVYFDTWVLQWFNHYTLDVGQTDADVLKSFEEFVRRHERANAINGGVLMGANDRWRWRGADHGDPAPCRCQGCKDSGVIRINH